MEIVKNDYFELGEQKYITLDTYNYLDNSYIFVNELTSEEEPTKNFKVFKNINNGLIEETDKEVLEIVLKYFESNFNLMLDEYDINN